MSDPRAIWPEMLRVISECKPDFVVAENVLGILSISDGLVFENVCTDLESEGYEVQSIIIPASGVGAYHQRKRVWFVAAHPDKGGWDGQIAGFITFGPDTTNDGHATDEGLQECESATGSDKPAQRNTYSGDEGGLNWPSESPVCSSINGLSGRLGGNRAKQLKGYGNAIVPQVAYQIFKAIEKTYSQ